MKGTIELQVVLLQPHVPSYEIRQIIHSPQFSISVKYVRRTENQFKCTLFGCVQWLCFGCVLWLCVLCGGVLSLCECVAVEASCSGNMHCTNLLPLLPLLIPRINLLIKGTSKGPP